MDTSENHDKHNLRGQLLPSCMVDGGKQGEAQGMCRNNEIHSIILGHNINASVPISLR